MVSRNLWHGGGGGQGRGVEGSNSTFEWEELDRPPNLVFSSQSPSILLLSVICYQVCGNNPDSFINYPGLRFTRPNTAPSYKNFLTSKSLSTQKINIASLCHSAEKSLAPREITGIALSVMIITIPRLGALTSEALTSSFIAIIEPLGIDRLLFIKHHTLVEETSASGWKS